MFHDRTAPAGGTIALLPVSDPPDGLEALLDRIAVAGRGPRIAVADIRAAAGRRSFGPLLAIAGLAAASPLGIIPGLPTAMALTVAIVAGQLVAGHEEVWLPRLLLRRTIDRRRVKAVIERARPLIRRIDRMFRPRLPVLTEGPAARLLGAVCIALALIMPPLEFVPFAATIPAAGVAVIGLSLLLRDGVLAVVGLAGMASVGALIATIVL